MSAAVAMNLPDAMECPRCGVEHNPDHCDGHRREDGTQCRQPRGYDTEHLGYGNCKFHGGRTPGGIKHAEAERERARYLLAVGSPSAARYLVRLVDDDDAPVGERRRAANDVLEKSGVAKTLVEHSGPDGGPIPIDVRQDQLVAELRALRAARLELGEESG